MTIVRPHCTFLQLLNAPVAVGEREILISMQQAHKGVENLVIHSQAFSANQVTLLLLS